MNKALS